MTRRESAAVAIESRCCCRPTSATPVRSCTISRCHWWLAADTGADFVSAIVPRSLGVSPWWPSHPGKESGCRQRQGRLEPLEASCHTERRLRSPDQVEAAPRERPCQADQE